MTELESWKLDEFSLKSRFLFEEITSKNLLSTGSFKSVAGISFSDFAKENDIVYCVLTNNSDEILKEFSINEG